MEEAADAGLDAIAMSWDPFNIEYSNQPPARIGISSRKFSMEASERY
ncbi:hypothetical protein [Nocardia sp. NPDC050175]